MKVIVTSPDAIIDNTTGQPFDGVVDALYGFKQLDKDNEIVAVSIDKKTFEGLPDFIQCLHINQRDRGSKIIERIIEFVPELKHSDVIALAAKDHDFFQAVNAKVTMLNAKYAMTNNPNDRLFANNYGIVVNKVDGLNIIFQNFLKMNEPWYFHFAGRNGDFDVYGMSDARTFSYNEDSNQIAKSLKSFIKNGNGQNAALFRIYTTLSSQFLHDVFSDVHYWGTYPTSSGDPNDHLESIKEKLRTSFKYSKFPDAILIRHKGSPRRHTLKEEDRIADGCKSQFDTIHLNEKYRELIKGKNVCIIDDYSTHGSSAETAYHLLKAAGVNKVLFIVLGKFKRDHRLYKYKITGDVFKPGFGYQEEDDSKAVTGNINPKATKEIVESLKPLI